ncbi:MAG: MGMT family protein [Dysgonomonas sp.]|uniref:MGMT family protein n=1 Tax=Dysgonomonas sp. TaxID=1891233 RepID=UPI0039E2D114
MTEKEKKEFTEAVHEIVRMIPYGRATSYRALAKASGYPNMSRMVGRIMSNSDSVNNDIPAYRVVNSQGVLSGKKAFGNSDEMEQLLEKEGVIIKNDRIQNWKQVFWNPMDEIKL